MDASSDVKSKEVIKDVAATLFAGMTFNMNPVTLLNDAAYELAGADTTLSSVQTLFLAMVNYLKVQLQAQEELDRVLQGRLPHFGDEDDLPYTSAIVKEILRWQPVTPLGAPACSAIH